MKKNKEIKLITAKINEIKALCCETPCDAVEIIKNECDINELERTVSYLKDELSYVYRYLYNLEEALYKHKNDGHLPKIPGVTAMKKALEVLGLSEEYEVEQKTIYASSGKKEKEQFIISLKK